MSHRIIILSALFLLVEGTQGVYAQDHSVTIPDGPVVRTDSLSRKPHQYFPPSIPLFHPLRQPDLLFAPSGIETKEQRAARINLRTYSNVMESMDNYLFWFKPPKLTKTEKYILYVARLFLSNPNSFPEGCVPLMNTSFPLIYAKTPGWAPYDYPYTPDKIPQCVKLEYDFATGTYKQVMADLPEFQGKTWNMSAAPSNQPVPNIPVTPVERMMR